MSQANQRDFPLPQARHLLADLFEPKIGFYLTDFLLSALAGWIAFFCALRFPLLSLENLALLLPTVLLLFRALMFIHPIFHLPRRFNLWMRPLFDLLCGFPLVMPYFLYESSHAAHHHRARYGTERDAEYVPFSKISRFRIPLFLLASLFLPLGLIVRFALIGPISLLHPAIRSTVWRRLSTLVTQPAFERELADEKEGWKWKIEEVGTSAVVLSLLLLSLEGIIGVQIVLQWLSVATSLALLSALQFMALHRYDEPGPELDTQIRDSLNTPGRWPWITALWAPVGQRFHALHHIFPTLPYHNLPTAHRRLIELLPEGSIYHRAENRSLFDALAGLWNRAGKRPARRSIPLFEKESDLIPAGHSRREKQ